MKAVGRALLFWNCLAWAGCSLGGEVPRLEPSAEPKAQEATPEERLLPVDVAPERAAEDGVLVVPPLPPPRDDDEAPMELARHAGTRSGVAGGEGPWAELLTQVLPLAQGTAEPDVTVEEPLAEPQPEPEAETSTVASLDDAPPVEDMMDPPPEGDSPPEDEAPQPPECSADADCSDALYCNGVERCDRGRCVGGEPIACEDTGSHCHEGNQRCEPAQLFAGAGDIAECDSPASAYTAGLLSDMLDSDPGARFFTLGDNVYPVGTDRYFEACYAPSWGAAHIKSRTSPLPGNHDYGHGGSIYGGVDGDAQGFRNYFAGQIGENGRNSARDGTYYSFDLGTTWHVIMLDSNCIKIEGGFGCAYDEPGSGLNSRQAEWLAADLATNTRPCVIAAWHHPRFSGGKHGDNDVETGNGVLSDMQPMWELLVEHDVELLLSGHDRQFERTFPLDAEGRVTEDGTGTRQFVAGTGGSPRSATATERSELVIDDTRGVLRLTLFEDSYGWQFVGIGDAPGDPARVLDEGWATCNGT